MNDAPVVPLRMGFVRGVAPSKWADRWNQVRRRRRMELVPINEHGDVDPDGVDLVLVRSAPGDSPEGSTSHPRVRHAVALYEEAVCLVLDSGHELATESSIRVEDLSLVRLLDHDSHSPLWPAPEPWADPEWKPHTYGAALDLVAAGLGGILMPMPLARHTIDKHRHRIIEVTGDIQGSRVFAAWRVTDDGDEIQELIGVLRGRTARSSRA